MFVCRMRSIIRRIAHAAMPKANPNNSLREISAALLPRINFFVNQMDSVLNFARGQTSADDTCVY